MARLQAKFDQFFTVILECLREQLQRQHRPRPYSGEAGAEVIPCLHWLPNERKEKQND